MNNWYGRDRFRNDRNTQGPDQWYRRPSERYDREDYYRNSNPDHLPSSDEESTWHFAGKFEDKNDPTYAYGTRERDLMREYPTYPTNDREYYQRHPRGRSQEHYDQGYSRSRYGYEDQGYETRNRPLNLTQRSGDMARNRAGENSDYGWRDGNESGGVRFGGSRNSARFSELDDFPESQYPMTSYAGRGPKGWKRSDDNIRDQVCGVLEENPHIDASQIEVDVKDGIVTLRGDIHDRQAKRLAEDSIQYLPGVKDVQNSLTVDKSFFEKAKDFLTGSSDIDASNTPSRAGRVEKNPRH